MTTFSYTTGNPANLTGGSNASMNDIAGPFTDLRTFLNNNAILDYGNLAAVVDSHPKTILETSNSLVGGIGSAVFLLGAGPNSVLSGGNVNQMVYRYLDSAQFPSGTRAPKLRLTASMFVNATASSANFVFGLYPITANGGGAGAVSATVNAVVAASQVTLASPPASSAVHGESGDFTFPAAGYYALGVSIVGTPPANTTVTWTVTLDCHAV